MQAPCGRRDRVENGLDNAIAAPVFAHKMWEEHDPSPWVVPQIGNRTVGGEDGFSAENRQDE